MNTSAKLDLNNLKWWKTGFDNTYIEEQLKRFLQQPGAASNVSDMAKAALIEGTLLEDTFAQIPMEVRGAPAQPGALAD